MPINIDRTKLLQALSPNNSLVQDVYMQFLKEHGLAGYYAWQGLAPDVYVNNLLTNDSYSDKGIEAIMQWIKGVDYGIESCVARHNLADPPSYYGSIAQPALTTQDLKLQKRIGNVFTIIGTEAVDIADWARFWVKTSCSGSTIRTYRWASGSPVQRISATDSDIASGKFGTQYFGRSYIDAVDIHFYPFHVEHSARLVAPTSETPLPLAYFEAPVVGSGVPPDSFRVELGVPDLAFDFSINPEKKNLYDEQKTGGKSDVELMTLPSPVSDCVVNRNAVNYSALIPCGSDGKPKQNTALVRVWSGSPAYLHSIEKRVKIIRDTSGITELNREDALKRAQQLDDKLHYHDLVPCSSHDSGGKCWREYNEWRSGTVGEDQKVVDSEFRKRYVKETKGW